MECLCLVALFALAMWKINVALGQAIEYPASTVQERGKTVKLLCEDAAKTRIGFQWFDVTGGSSTQIFDGTAKSSLPKYTNFQLDNTTDSSKSVVVISDIKIEDEGAYQCDVIGNTDPPSYSANVTVEVPGEGPHLSSNCSKYIENEVCMATCKVTGSKPAISFKWTIGEVEIPSVEAVETTTDPNLMDTTSNCTFIVSADYNNQSLQCATEGHQLEYLNGKDTTLLDVQFAPDGMGICFEDYSAICCDLKQLGNPPSTISISYEFGSEIRPLKSESGKQCLNLDLRMHSGVVFTCLAENDIGSVSQSGSPGGTKPCYLIMSMVIPLGVCIALAVSISIVICCRKEKGYNPDYYICPILVSSISAGIQIGMLLSAFIAGIAYSFWVLGGLIVFLLIFVALNYVFWKHSSSQTGNINNHFKEMCNRGWIKIVAFPAPTVYGAVLWCKYGGTEDSPSTQPMTSNPQDKKVGPYNDSLTGEGTDGSSKNTGVV